MAAELVILSAEQVRQLADVIWHQEANGIHNLKFRSEADRAAYLADCNSNHNTVVSLLDRGAKQVSELVGNQTLAPAANEIFSYIVVCANTALQAVRNYTLRKNYISKISAHADSLLGALEELKTTPGEVTRAARLAKDASLYRNALLQYTRQYQSTVSRNFSKWLKDTGIKFQDLVQRYQAKLNLEGRFADLEDENKIKVYEEIIGASGRARPSVTIWSKVFGVGGIALIVVTVGIMVWDIFSSEHILQTATHDAVVTAASIGGALVGEVVGAALSTELVGVEASAFFVMMAGLVTGIVGAFVLGSFAGALIDLIFGSGGSAPLSTDGLRCYVAPMPDGVTLARQIAHG